jgi:hypothetical protein
MVDRNICDLLAPACVASFEVVRVDPDNSGDPTSTTTMVAAIRESRLHRVGVPPAIRFDGPVHLGLGMILTAGLRSGQVYAHAAPLEANPAAREIFTRQRQKGQRRVAH